MARTRFATEIHDTSQKGERDPNVLPFCIVIHHAATTNFDYVVQLELGEKEVSSTAVIKDGKIASMFDEKYRAWSLSSEYWDSVSLSVETCNQTTAPNWDISNESYESLAKVCADWCIRYNIAPHRNGKPETWTVIGHREVYTIHDASYATACPGGIDLDRLVQMIKENIGAQTAAEEVKPLPVIERKKDSMTHLAYIPKNTKDNPNKSYHIFIEYGPGYYLEFTGQHAADMLADQIGAPAFPVSRTWANMVKRAVNNGVTGTYPEAK